LSASIVISTPAISSYGNSDSDSTFFVVTMILFSPTSFASMRLSIQCSVSRSAFTQCMKG